MDSENREFGTESEEIKNISEEENVSGTSEPEELTAEEVHQEEGTVNDIEIEPEECAEVPAAQPEAPKAPGAGETYSISYAPDMRDNVYNTAYSAPVYPSPVYPEAGKQKKEKKKKEKKQKGRPGIGVIAVIAAIAVVLSCGAGVLGAYLSNTYLCRTESRADGEKETVPTDPTVIYRSVETKKDGGEKGVSPYADVAALVADSVVEIRTEYTTMGLWQYVKSGAGSGVIISEDGYIITNNHVVARSDNSSRFADKVSVTLRNGDKYDAKVIGGDSDADIAVIKIEAEDLTAAVFGDSDGLVVGEEVMAIGNPLGELGGTITNGIISALAREITIDGIKLNLLQTNAAINPGNSGGGLFNMKGELIGVVNAKSSGTGIEGLGFAIPSNDALEVSTEIRQHGEVIKDGNTPVVGITIVNVSSAQEAMYYGVNALGVYIAKVSEGENEDKFQQGDRIIAVDGNEITSNNDVISAVQKHSAGDEVEFVLYRGRKMITVRAKCYLAETEEEETKNLSGNES